MWWGKMGHYLVPWHFPVYIEPSASLLLLTSRPTGIHSFLSSYWLLSYWLITTDDRLTDRPTDRPTDRQTDSIVTSYLRGTASTTTIVCSYSYSYYTFIITRLLYNTLYTPTYLYYTLPTLLAEPSKM